MSAAGVALTLYAVAAVAFSLVAAWWAARRARAKGRRPWLWALLGLLFGLFAIAAVSLLPARSE